MKSTFLILTLFFIMTGTAISQRPVKLTRPCTSTTTASKIEITRVGDVNLVPCSGRSVLVNGSGLSGILNSLNGLTATAQTFATPTAADTAAWSSASSTHTLQLPITAVSGTSRTTYFPYFNAANTLARSGFTWDLTTYRWDNSNTTPNTLFPMVYTPENAGSGGTFSVGSSSSAQIVASRASSSITLTTPNLFVSATNYSLNPTITTGGTTGNQTINAALGTVNFAAGASAITVTNSAATANSLIFATARTNDTTCSVKSVVPASGSFTIRMTANCTAETSVAFWVTN